MSDTVAASLAFIVVSAMLAGRSSIIITAVIAAVVHFIFFTTIYPCVMLSISGGLLKSFTVSVKVSTLVSMPSSAVTSIV